jgi:SAM-dependent methyltransferase
MKEDIVLRNSSPHPFEIVWSKRFGRGLIDCHYDSATSTISVCDLSGLTVISDLSGKELERTVFDMPAWGVAHRFAEHGFIIACALANKTKNQGAIVLRRDSVDLFRIDYETECWDVHFADEFLYWTMWDGRCGRLRLSDIEAGADYIDLGASAYGLSAYDNKIFAIAQGMGILQIDDGLSFTPKLILSDSNICYNSIYSESFSRHYAGSSGNSPVVQGIEFAAQPPLDDNICGIAALGDFLFVGSLTGELTILAPSVTSHALGTLKFQDGIWNLSIVHDINVLYVACGDGSLYCIAIKEQFPLLMEIQAVEAAFENIEESYKTLFDLTNVFTITLASTFLEERWDALSNDELKIAGLLLQQWILYLSDGRINYLLGLYFNHLSRFDDAIVALQKVKPDQEHFVKSLMPLSKAFEGISALSSAIIILQINLEKIPNQQVGPFLYRIGKLFERHGERERAFRAYEMLSLLQHSYPGVQDALRRLTCVNEVTYSKRDSLSEPISVEEMSISVMNDAGPLGKRRVDQYDLRSYIRYETSSPSDEAKKHLETNHMLNVVLQVENRTKVRTALDIGCATGRWPTWIAQRGYQAHGYDISQVAIDICTAKVSNNEKLDMSFTRHDISDGPLINDYFALVTCMMGTFNHVPKNRLPEFLNGIVRTMRTDGLFAFTSWNAGSPFCDFLQLDGQTAKDTLRTNVMDISSLKSVLQNNGLRVLHEIPMCFLPNKCYDVWENSFKDVEVIQRIDAFLRGTLTDGKPQMYFIVAERFGCE